MELAQQAAGLLELAQIILPNRDWVLNMAFPKSVEIMLYFLEFSVEGVIQYIVFFIWLLQLGTITLIYPRFGCAKDRSYRIHSGKTPRKQQTREGEESEFHNSHIPRCTMFSFHNKKTHRCRETEK